jgi:hypothetical protein
MPVISGGTIIEGGLGPYRSAGAPAASTSENQLITITGTPTGGTFTLSFCGYTTTPLAYNAANAAVIAALEALPNIGAGGVTAGSGGPLPGTALTVAFAGGLAGQPVPAMTATASFTGGTTPAIAITRSVPGVAATGRGAAKGALLVDTTNGKLYVNTGTEAAPTWVVAGTQT